MSATSWMTIPAAAKRMGVHRSTAWRRLQALQRRYPEREILRAYNETTKRPGKMLVCPRALLEAMHRDREDSLEILGDDVEQLTQRVGSLETLLEVVQMRLTKLEKEKRTEKTAERMRLLKSSEAKLVAFGRDS